MLGLFKVGLMGRQATDGVFLMSQKKEEER